MEGNIRRRGEHGGHTVWLPRLPRTGRDYSKAAETGLVRSCDTILQDTLEASGQTGGQKLADTMDRLRHVALADRRSRPA